jgi:DNA polymerase
MTRKLHIDIETYSSVDITTCGSYKYFESPDFEILMISFAFGNDPISLLDLAGGDKMPIWFEETLKSPSTEKHAHNANFERNAFKAYGFETPIDQWHCSAIKAGYCGLPLALFGASRAMKLEEYGKSAAGKALIKLFCGPVKPTKANGMKTRIYPEDAPEKWGEFKEYCRQDVVAEREIDKRLSKYTLPESERLNYFLDQKINDRGILIDLKMAQNAYDIDNLFSAELYDQMKAITKLDNPNSPAQLKKWLEEQTGKRVTTLAKGELPALIKDCSSYDVQRVLELRLMNAKTSTKKYLAMLNCACDDNRAHGLFQFYGANRTGRWAGRLIQMQNLPQNHLDTAREPNGLEEARALIVAGDYDHVTLMYEDIPSVLSQLIRTAFVAKEGHTFAVADFSAIEARVIAWLSGEAWRLKVFNSHGKIYEASASKMFNVPIEAVTKGSDYRAKGKVAELALGYQGAVGALKTMGGEKMGLSDMEMDTIVKKWRKANPAIVALWGDIESCTMRAIQTRKKVISIHKNLEFDCDGDVMTIKLPSGRKLFYQSPSFTENKWGRKAIQYKGMDQTTKQWTNVDTYGGKLTENIVQAIARDLLADAMLRLDKAGFDIVMHVHDEAVVEIPDNGEDLNDRSLTRICHTMGETSKIYTGVPFPAEGYLTPYYKKD